MANVPSKTLSLVDTVSIIIGIVVGAGIFVFPSLVASNVASGQMLMMVWLAGGIISFIGALCYAELATTYPDAGGDYSFLKGSYGNSISFMFAWARMLIIQPGAIVMVAFIIGDEITRYFPIGEYSSPIYAAVAIFFLTVINAAGIRQGRMTQKFLTSAILLGLLVLIGIAFSAEPASQVPGGNTFTSGQAMSGLGMAMLFVLFTYSGWNESAYVSAEIKNPERNIIKSLLIGIGTVTVIYLLVNYGLYRALGLEQMAQHGAQHGAPQMLVELTLGPAYVPFISAILLLAALSTTNATILTGGRSNYALGRNFRIFAFMGHWREKSGTPAGGLIFQALISLALVLFGALYSKSGIEAMVDYTSPAFWFFFLLVGISLFIYRNWDGSRPRPFRVPLYPLTPLVFVIVCVYMLQNSLSYTGSGALVSAAVLIAAVPVILLNNRLSGQP